MSRKPLSPQEIEERKTQILNAAVTITRTHGYRGVTRDAVAQQAGVSGGTINRFFGTFGDLMEEVMRKAVEQSILPIVAQGLAHKHRVAMLAPVEVQQAAMASIGGVL